MLDDEKRDVVKIYPFQNVSPRGSPNDEFLQTLVIVDDIDSI
jgi:hypothetical protein